LLRVTGTRGIWELPRRGKPRGTRRMVVTRGARK
jgi:hypothetical protein